MSLTSQIRYEVILPSKHKEISDFLMVNFFPNEPISRAFGLPNDQVARWFPAQIEDCLKLGASIDAIDAKTGKLVGVAINIIAEKTLSSKPKTGEAEKEGRGLLDILNPVKESVMVNIAKFLGILNQVPDSVYGQQAIEGPQPLKTFNCIYLATLPEYGGQGIGKRMIEESEKVAKQRNISLLQVDTTSEFSYQIFHKHCGYQVVREIDLVPYIPGINKVDGGAHKKGRILLKHII